jgi:hydrogenase expression/formation protein HypE
MDKILLAHGAGGKLTHELIRTIFRAKFSNPALNQLNDSAILKAGNARIAFTTDSFVVNPIIFPGGDIGKLAVCGTVNDLAMAGAQPLAISVAAIIEEGLPINILKTITASIAKAAAEAGVIIATGDTKVVEKGKADKLFLTTTGIGIVAKGIKVSGANAKPDAVLINGNIAEHGMAVMSARNDFKLKSEIKSDCAPLNGLTKALLSKVPSTHVLRDPTRGGVATTLNEIAEQSNVGIIINQAYIPLKPMVQAACALLGIDPLYVANEGKVLAIVPKSQSSKAISAMKTNCYGKDSSVIGEVVKAPKGVWLRTAMGGLRPLAMLTGDQLPRIC